MTECAVCGLAPCDLPDGVDPEDIFDTEDGETRCRPCATGGSLSVVYIAGGDQ